MTATQLSFAYNQDGTLKSVGYGTGDDTRSFGYDDLDRQTSDTLATAAGATVAATTYGYDPDDQLTAKTTSGTAGASTDSYTYDPSGRMTSWTSDGTTTRYAWDASGNLVRNGSDTLVYDERDELVSDDNNTYTYTARGTRATVSGSTAQTYSYDAFDRMVSGGGVQNTYDGLDRLATSAGASFTYAGAGTDLTGDGTETDSRLPDGELLALSQGGSATLALTDTRGDLTGTFGSAATALTGSTAYSPLGVPTATSGPAHHTGYQGAWTDPTTGQVDMNARWYDPTTGSFDSRDTQQSPAQPSINANPYTYANGDPNDNTDPTGHFSRSDGGGGGGLGMAADESLMSELESGLEGLLGRSRPKPRPSPHEDLTPEEIYPTIRIASDTELYENVAAAHAYDEMLYSVYGSASTAGSSGNPPGPCDYSARPCSRTSSPASPGDPGPGTHNGPYGGGTTCTSDCSSTGTPLPPPPPQDPCALHHCTVPPGPVDSGTIATVVNLLSVDGAVAAGTETDLPGGTAWSVETAEQTQAGIFGLGDELLTDALGEPGSDPSPRLRDGGPDDENRDGCSTGAGFNVRKDGSLDTSYVYLPRHRQGVENECVATGAFAQLGPGSFTPSPRPRLNFALPGLRDLPDDNRARGHLIGYAMGGSNKDTRNFVPMYQEANQWMWEKAESPVVSAIQSGGSVFVESIPRYGNPASTVPTEIDFTTTGQVQEECVIMNNPTASGSHCSQGMFSASQGRH